MSRIKHLMPSLFGFFHENVKKKLDTQMSEVKHPMSVLYGLFHENVKKKLDTQMSEVKHPMSVWYGFFHENVHKNSIPKCQELSIRCHFFWIFPWKCQKKLDTQMSQIKHPIALECEWMI